MPVRIYTLAKDLKLDSKELVDLCNKIGITGKGSALASLEDEEVLRIKKHLESASAAKTEERPAPSQAPAPPAAPVRGSGFVGRPQIIPPRRKPTVNATPMAPIKLNMGVARSSVSHNVGMAFSGKPKKSASNGATSKSGNPVTNQ